VTNQPIWRQIHEFVHADPEHQKLVKAHRTACDLLTAHQSDVTAGTYKLQRLLVARDAVQHFCTETECTTSEQDDMLLQWTATHGEAWCGMFSAAAADITVLVLDQCEALTLQGVKTATLRERRGAALALVRESAERLEAQYKTTNAAS
jgi:hypothetical protein